MGRERKGGKKIMKNSQYTYGNTIVVKLTFKEHNPTEESGFLTKIKVNSSSQQKIIIF